MTLDARTKGVCLLDTAEDGRVGFVNHDPQDVTQPGKVTWRVSVSPVFAPAALTSVVQPHVFVSPKPHSVHTPRGSAQR